MILATQGKPQAPQATAELARILALPRREWSDRDREKCARVMTARLAKPGGTMALRPIQGVALLEIALCGGGFLPIRVAGGKTLISLLAPTVLGSQRPLLLVPAKLREKTRRAWRTLAYHWNIYPSIKIESFELMSRSQATKLLEQWRPDAIIADEAHKLKDPRAGVTRRVRWYLEANPTCRYVDMSGSITKRSIKDYAHRAGWALRHGSPVPIDYRDLKTWSEVLDEKPGAWRAQGDQPDPGALVALGRDVREGFRRRCHDTLGWVATRESEISIPVIGEIERLDVPPTVAQALTHLRGTWSSPERMPEEGEAVYEYAPEVWAHARQIALGFFYRWDPPAPEAWRRARKAWAQHVRHILETNHRRLATPLDVANAVDQGFYPEASPALAEWREQRPTFDPRTKAVWIDDFAIRWAKDRLDDGGPALLWTEHRAFAERLASETGVPFFAGGGKCTRTGRSILDHSPREPAICSIKAIGEGFDLQAYARNVVVSAPANGKDWEQLLGRTLRPGQQADEIGLTVLSTCLEHESALSQGLADAAYIEATTGQKQIILTVDWT